MTQTNLYQAPVVIRKAREGVWRGFRPPCNLGWRWIRRVMVELARCLAKYPNYRGIRGISRRTLEDTTSHINISHPLQPWLRGAQPRRILGSDLPAVSGQGLFTDESTRITGRRLSIRSIKSLDFDELMKNFT